jgi:endonuclease YncB( thermonuclease family)
MTPPPFVLALSILVVCTGSAGADCARSQGETARAASAVDGRTILLEDGREVLLAGLAPGPASPEARLRLEQLVAGKALRLDGLAGEPDRYGRHAAFPTLGGSEAPVQYDLLREGLARATGPAGTPGCLTALLTQEKQARAAGLGLWSDPVYEVRQADRPETIGRGRFLLVEGKPLSVRESGGTIYVNFGRRWSEDFTLTIPKRLERRFAAAGIPPRALTGRSLRVRGIVEERGGPWIEAVRPDQIEIAEAQESRPQR